MQHGFVRVSTVFIVNGKPPEVFKPGESALYNPFFRHGYKSVRAFVGPEYDIQVAMQRRVSKISSSKPSFFHLLK